MLLETQLFSLVYYKNSDNYYFLLPIFRIQIRLDCRESQFEVMGFGQKTH